MKTKIFTETASETQPKHRGWPKGKPRGPRKHKAPIADWAAAKPTSPLERSQWFVDVVTGDGKYSALGTYETQDEAEAALSECLQTRDDFSLHGVRIIRGVELEPALKLQFKLNAPTHPMATYTMRSDEPLSDAQPESSL